MTREELAVVLQEWYCGCGNPEDASGALLHLLELHPLYDAASQQDLDTWIPDSGVRHLLLYMLDRLDLTEHGGSVGGGWLTDNGEAVRDALRSEKADNFAALHGPDRCVHGHDVMDDSHDCAAG